MERPDWRHGRQEQEAEFASTLRGKRAEGSQEPLVLRGRTFVPRFMTDAQIAMAARWAANDSAARAIAMWNEAEKNRKGARCQAL